MWAISWWKLGLALAGIVAASVGICWGLAWLVEAFRGPGSR